MRIIKSKLHSRMKHIMTLHHFFRRKIFSLHTSIRQTTSKQRTNNVQTTSKQQETLDQLELFRPLPYHQIVYITFLKQTFFITNSNNRTFVICMKSFQLYKKISHPSLLRLLYFREGMFMSNNLSFTQLRQVSMTATSSIRLSKI